MNDLLALLPDPHPTNRSGVFGCAWDKARLKWAVRLNVNGQRRRYGRHTYMGSAVLAVARARGISA